MERYRPVPEELLPAVVEPQSDLAPLEMDLLPDTQMPLESRHSMIGDILATGAVMAGMLGVLTLVLTPEQRKAIRQRDGDACKFPHPHGDECDGRLEVHHVRPQRYLKDRGYTEEQIDVPENLLTLCQHAHCDHVHLDMRRARKEYKENKNSYREVFSRREQAMQDGRPYWNTAYDKAMKLIASNRTIEAMREGWKYPLKRRAE